MFYCELFNITKEGAIMKNSCSNCNYCVQYFTGDYYPEFGCAIAEDLKEDEMFFPSVEEGCEKWIQNKREKWTD